MKRWYLSGIAVGALVGWAAAKCYVGGWAPVGLVSLAVGGCLGLAAGQLAHLAGVLGRKQLVIGTVLFALVAVFAEHTWLYRDFRRQWTDARAREPQVALFRPEAPWSPAEYLRHEWSPSRLAFWCVDAMLIVASAVGVALARRHQVAKSASQATRPSLPDS